MAVFDPRTAGFIFADTQQRQFHLGFAVARADSRVDCGDMSFVLNEVGPAGDAGSHGRIAFETTAAPPLLNQGGDGELRPGLTIEWLCIDAHAAVFRIWIDFEGVLEVRGSFPAVSSGAWIAGEAYMAAVSGDSARALWISLLTEGEKPPVMAGSGPANGAVCAHVEVRSGSVARLAVGFDRSTHGAHHRVDKLNAATVDALLNDVDATTDDSTP